MVWVWPPHTSMNLYCRPGSHRAAIWAASAWAFSASRNSSTKRTLGLLPLLDPGVGQGGQLVGVGLADPLEEVEGGLGLLLVDLGQGEADVDQHPVARRQLLVLEQADVDRPPDPAHVDLCQVGAVVHQLDDLTRNAQTHSLPLSIRGLPLGYLSPRTPLPGGWLPGSARRRPRSPGPGRRRPGRRRGGRRPRPRARSPGSGPARARPLGRRPPR